jgi:hypothetical protein
MGALFLAGPELQAMCSGPSVGPRLLRATVEACHVPEQEIRKAMEPYRAHHERWLAGFPEPIRAAKDFDKGIDHRIARGDVVVRLKVTRSRQLSADPRGGVTVTAELWKAEASEARDYLLHLGSGGCDSLSRGREALFLEDFKCCDVIPSSDNACLLDLPALVPVPAEVEAMFGAVP